MMVHHDVSARRRCCAEAQARGGAAAPPGKWLEARSGWGPGTKDRHRSFMGKQLRHCRAGIYPHAFFSLGPVHPFLPGEAGDARRGNNNNTMALPMGPVPSIAARDFQ